VVAHKKIHSLRFLYGMSFSAHDVFIMGAKNVKNSKKLSRIPFLESSEDGEL
jgi:hypothetical protein